MVNVAQAVGSGANAAQYARASAASAALTAEPVEVPAASESAANLSADQTVLSAERAYRYNSFEFSYRQDFGKIVLLRQKPDTGELVQQFPSEYYLRKYAASQRVAQTAAGEGGKSGSAPANSAPTSDGAPAKTGTSQPTAPAPAPTVAPTVQSAPALPSAGASAGSSAPVNLTV